MSRNPRRIARLALGLLLLGAGPASAQPADLPPAEAPVVQPGPAEGPGDRAPGPARHLWPWRFTDDQVARLRAAGCPLGWEDLRAARRLAARGFTAEQFVVAWADLQLYATEVPRRSARRLVDAAAVFRVHGIPWTRLASFAESGRRLTAWWNHDVVGSRAPYVAGKVLIPLAVLSLVGGAGLTAYGLPEIRRHDLVEPGGLWGRLAVYTGAFLLLTGIVELSVGIPMLRIGRRKEALRLPEGFLDEGPVDALRRSRGRRPRVRAHDEEGARLYLVPSVLPGGAGLGLDLRF